MVVGILTGIAAQRFESARAAWRFWKERKATLPALRALAYTRALRAIGYVLAAFLLLFLILHVA